MPYDPIQGQGQGHYCLKRLAWRTSPILCRVRRKTRTQTQSVTLLWFGLLPCTRPLHCHVCDTKRHDFKRLWCTEVPLVWHCTGHITGTMQYTVQL